MRAAPLFPVVLALFASPFVPSRARAEVPNKNIPPSVLMEVRVVESEFKSALASDCAPGRCFVKGCVYEEHITLDQPRAASLPGLPTDEGPGSVVPQEYLTRARCEFTHESTVRAGDVQKLARRLEKRLSRGWLKVVVAPEKLDPIPKSLSEPEPEDEPEEKKDDEPLAPPPEPPELTSELALRQLWERLLPHTPWMLAIFLVTMATLALIWGGRRLGAPSLEEKMMEAQMAQPAPPPPEPVTPSEVIVEDRSAAKEDAFAEEQEQLWRDRLEKMTQSDDDIIARLLREWLRQGDYPKLARALLVFGDRVSSAFEGSPELALKKVEFAAYFRDVDEAALPSKARFFRDLNQQAMASVLLSQEDVHLYRSLREDFGASGFVGLMRELPARYGALMYALADYEQQQEVAALMPADLRKQVATELLSSTRISVRESGYLSDCLDTVRDGEPIPDAPPTSGNLEHGPPVDSARALSVLLSHVSGTDRQALFVEEQRRHGGSLPQWHEDIAFNHMLTALPEETRNDLLLELDIRSLGAWLQTQPAEWRRAFVSELSEPLQNALAKTPLPPTRAEVFRYAAQGHRELVTALKATYARRGIRFVDLVA